METFMNPFISSIITIYTIILLYLPSYFIGLICSPVFISTFTLLLYLLRLGATQEESEKENKLNSAGVVTGELNSTSSVVFEELLSAEIVPEELNSAPTQPPLQQVHELSNVDHWWVSCQIKEEAEDVKKGSGSGPGPDHYYVDSFLEWDMRAPLEVIYEASEGEEEEQSRVVEETQKAIIARYASLSMYFPETDTDTSSSEADFPLSPENMGYRWDEEDGEGLIEIALDGKRKHEVEEENLIEIDLLRRYSREDDDVFCRRVNNDELYEEFRHN